MSPVTLTSCASASFALPCLDVWTARLIDPGRYPLSSRPDANRLGGDFNILKPAAFLWLPGSLGKRPGSWVNQPALIAAEPHSLVAPYSGSLSHQILQ
jgi:hypothetical protein